MQQGTIFWGHNGYCPNLKWLDAGVGGGSLRQSSNESLALCHMCAPPPERRPLRARCPQRHRLVEQLSRALPAVPPAAQGTAAESRMPKAERCVVTLLLLVLVPPVEPKNPITQYLRVRPHGHQSCHSTQASGTGIRQFSSSIHPAVLSICAVPWLAKGLPPLLAGGALATPLSGGALQQLRGGVRTHAARHLAPAQPRAPVSGGLRAGVPLAAAAADATAAATVAVKCGMAAPGPKGCQRQPLAVCGGIVGAAFAVELLCPVLLAAALRLEAVAPRVRRRAAAHMMAVLLLQLRHRRRRAIVAAAPLLAAAAPPIWRPHMMHRAGKLLGIRLDLVLQAVPPAAVASPQAELQNHAIEESVVRRLEVPPLQNRLICPQHIRQLSLHMIGWFK